MTNELDYYSFAELYSLLDNLIKVQNVPLLIGEAGIGKSSFIRHFADKLGTKSFTIHCNQLVDRSDLTGQYRYEDPNIEDINTRFRLIFFANATVRDAIEYANNHPDETPILFIDEFNRTSPDVTTAIMSLVTDRELGNTKLPDNVKLIYAGNDTGHITEVDSATVTRFVVLKIRPDATEFRTIHRDNLNKFVDKFLETNPSLILSYPVTRESDTDEVSIFNENGLDQFATPRTIYSLSQWLDFYSDNELLYFNNVGILLKMIRSCVGDTVFASTFYEYLSDELTNTTSPDGLSSLLGATTYADITSTVSNMDQNEINAYIMYMIDTDKMHENETVTKELIAKLTDIDAGLINMISTTTLSEETKELFRTNAAPNIIATIESFIN